MSKEGKTITSDEKVAEEKDDSTARAKRAIDRIPLVYPGKKKIDKIVMYNNDLHNLILINVRWHNAQFKYDIITL